jgi:hypothetical protein
MKGREMEVRRQLLMLVMVAALGLVCSGAGVAAPGDIIADVDASPSAGGDALFGVSVGFDGNFLYYTNFNDTVLHRIDVPPAGGPTPATGHTDFPIVGAASGINAFSYDATRDVFWAAGGDGVSIYQITNPTTNLGMAIATLQYMVDPIGDRPGNCDNGFGCPSLIDGLAYDGQDDTIWYSPDASQRIYHYDTDADIDSTAVLLGAIDVNDPPNDMVPECGFNYSSGVAAGLNVLYLGADGCPFYFRYSKTGVKQAAFPYNFERSEDFECDDVSYNVDVIWARDAFDGHLRAFEQPTGTCTFGGGVVPPILKGRMTGGANLLATNPAGAEAKIAVTIHCDVTVNPNRMQVNWIDPSTGASHRFHMTSMTSARCSDDPTITPNPPGANFDTHDGEGTGRYDGTPGATAEWRLQDAGEPGTGVDRGSITITDANNNVVLEASGPTLRGDWQAHNTK